VSTIGATCVLARFRRRPAGCEGEGPLCGPRAVQQGSARGQDDACGSSGRAAWKAAWKQERAFSSNSALAGHSTKWPPALIPISRLVAWKTSERYKARVRGARASSTKIGDVTELVGTHIDVTAQGRRCKKPLTKSSSPRIGFDWSSTQSRRWSGAPDQTESPISSIKQPSTTRASHLTGPELAGLALFILTTRRACW
jgi:hypothetical protein